ncbi:MAG: RNA-binding cell elongation regulator Jag/EloR, partial [Clostridia bacterium]
MNKTIECTGKTIDEAIENALAQLGVERDEVSVEVLEKAKTGFLGIGGAPAKVAVTYDEPCAGGGESNLEGFLDGLLKRMGATAEITVENKDDGNIAVELVGENMGVLIGRRGETLDAIQHIANLVVNRGDGNHARVTVDTENYRKKREETLEALAKKVASQVIKYKRNKA